MEREFIVEIFDPVTIVSEMATGSDVLVSIPPDTLEAIKQDDENPRFATFVIESGWSKSKRLWGPEVFESVQEQINNPGNEPIVGYLGHIRPDDDPYSFPDVQFQWLKAKLGRAGDKVRLFTKAYVLPDTKARYYLKRGIAKSVSWRGEAIQKPIKGGVSVADFTMESIDLARPRKAGMSARMVGALASEMEEGGNSVKPEEIAALQENELRAHNPLLVKVIEEKGAEPLNTKIGEQTTEIEKLKESDDALTEIRKELGVDEKTDVLDVVKQYAAKLREAGKTVRESILRGVIEKKFKDEPTRKLMQRVLATEMTGLDLKLDEDHRSDDEKKVAEMVNNFVNEDEDLKSLVSEMEENPPTPPGSGSDDRGKPRELKAGYANSRIRVRAANR
jgi:hypothetical protein